ncbi:hypothetical protein A3A66_01150 [Microgenomates group bacterium RIFCSPLOWO2_01_FULL_46_13]|nr:MAG: hypothetical protein A2783_01105 [Microgenomates group bacterium RIFCSPHIGHO2_01_FULL_45_11]OGV94611.1 MAG: hypothetical protein A3A66_01150 [Microgenomates group bacterium RIFCSPLOWO2_01_FULL_46_13]
MNNEQKVMSSVKKIVRVLGSPVVPQDSLVIKLLPRLKRQFPKVEFKEFDPTETLEQSVGKCWLLDSAVGIDTTTVFDDIDKFILVKSVSVHDYDLGFELSLLKKLKKLPKINIVAVPANLSEKKAAVEVAGILKANGF